MSKIIRVFLSTVLVAGTVVSFILVWMWFWLALVDGKPVFLKGGIVFIYAAVLISLIRLKVADL